MPSRSAHRCGWRRPPTSITPCTVCSSARSSWPRASLSIHRSPRRAAVSRRPVDARRARFSARRRSSPRLSSVAAGQISVIGLSVSDTQPLHAHAGVHDARHHSASRGTFAPRSHRTRAALWRFVRFSRSRCRRHCLLSPVLYASASGCQRLPSSRPESSGAAVHRRRFARALPAQSESSVLASRRLRLARIPAQRLPRKRGVDPRDARGNAGVGGVDGMAAVAVVGWSRGTLWCLGSRPLHSRRRPQHVRTGTLGASSLCANPRTDAIAHSLLAWS